MKVSSDLDLQIFILRRQIADTSDLIKYHESRYEQVGNINGYALAKEAKSLKHLLDFELNRLLDLKGERGKNNVR